MLPFGINELPHFQGGRSDQAGRHETHAHLDHDPWPTAIHQAADEGAEDRRDEEAEGERPGRHAPLPAELGEYGREEQRKGGTRVDAQAHGDEGHSHDDPAVEDGEMQWDGHSRPSPAQPPQRPRSASIAAHGLAYAADAGIRCTGGSPRAARWMFSAMRCARASSIPSVQPDTWGVMSTLGNS